MVVLATWFLPLVLSNSVASIINLQPENFVHILETSDYWNFIILPGIFLYCFDKQTFPKLLVSLPRRFAFPPDTF